MNKVAVYRHFDADGHLLYVGQSSNPHRRLKEHLRAGDWAHSVARIEVEWFESREAASRAETEQIVRLAPRHNLRDNAGEGAARDVAGIVNAIGRQRMCAVLDIGNTAISNAIVKGAFPACWFAVMKRLADQAGIDCPIGLFSMKFALGAAE